jgi:tRNA pseudouridine55 synthase
MSSMSDTKNVEGLLVLDKPIGITSRKAVDRAGRWFGRGARIGHTGTLDPLATGVLVLCLGRATRLAEYVQLMGKVYTSVFRLGATSHTDDGEGPTADTPGATDPGVEAVTVALSRFVGTTEQVPPAFSAAHVAGRRAHELARAGKEVVLAPRPVQIHGIVVQRYAYPEVEVEVRCGKGTYIRSLARDLGNALGCGAYVQALRRESVGPFAADGAVSLDADAASARAGLLPAGLALGDLPRVVLGARRIARFRAGQALDLPVELAGRTGEVGVFDEAGDVVAVGVLDAERGLLRPDKVFAKNS